MSERRLETRWDHPCERVHRRYAGLARCLWPEHEAIDGEGPFATVSYCQTPSIRHNTTTVLLWVSEDAARKAMAEIDDTGCGGGCRGHHALIRLYLQAPERKPERARKDLWPPTIVWGRERGWLLVQDPVDGSWFSIPAKEAPSGWARIASEAKLR